MNSALLKITLPLAFAAAASLCPAQLPAHLETGLDLVDQIAAAQSQGVIYKPNTSPAVPYNRYGGSWNSASNPSGYTLANLGSGIYAENNTTCAPLVTHLLRNVHGWNWSKVPFIDPFTHQSTTSASPTPYRYVALMKQRKGFPDGPVARLAEVRPGHVFSIWEPGLIQQAHDHTGLVVSVAPAGVAYPDHPTSDPAFLGTTLVPMTVLDSTSSPHGAGDSRYFHHENSSYTIPGAGIGVMGVLVDAQGVILGHTWSMPPADAAANPASWLSQFESRFRPQSERELVIARHEKQPAN
jgi:hypothetical protein